MGTIDLDAGPDCCWAPTELKAGELLGQLERGKGASEAGWKTASNAGHRSEYAQALSEANATRQDANR